MQRSRSLDMEIGVSCWFIYWAGMLRLAHTRYSVTVGLHWNESISRKWTVCFTKKEAGFSGTEQGMMAMMITKVYFLLFSFYQSEARWEKMCFEKPFRYPSFHISLLNLDGNGSNREETWFFFLYKILHLTAASTSRLRTTHISSRLRIFSPHIWKYSDSIPSASPLERRRDSPPFK